MDPYFTNWTSRSDTHSWIDQSFSPYDLLEQNSTKELSNRVLDTALHGQDNEINDEEAEFMLRDLKAFSIVQLVNKIRDIHNMTYELGVNEGLEMIRARLLNIFEN